MFHTGADGGEGGEVKEIGPGLVGSLVALGYQDRWTVRSLAVAAHVTILANYF